MPPWAMPLMGLPGAVAAMQLNLVQLQIIAVKALNSSATIDAHGLVPIPLLGGGALPAAVWFPATRGALMGLMLSNARATALLAAYGLPAIAGANNVAVHAKRLAIAQHLGVRNM